MTLARNPIAWDFPFYFLFDEKTNQNKTLHSFQNHPEAQAEKMSLVIRGKAMWPRRGSWSLREARSWEGAATGDDRLQSESWRAPSWAPVAWGTGCDELGVPVAEGCTPHMSPSEPWGLLPSSPRSRYHLSFSLCEINVGSVVQLLDFSLWSEDLFIYFGLHPVCFQKGSVMAYNDIHIFNKAARQKRKIKPQYLQHYLSGFTFSYTGPGGRGSKGRVMGCKVSCSEGNGPTLRRGPLRH